MWGSVHLSCASGATNFWPSCQAKYPNQRPRDLWLHNATYEGPASALVNTSTNCSVGVHDLCSGDGNECPAYPGFPGPQQEDCNYVDETFSHFVLDTVRRGQRKGPRVASAEKNHIKPHCQNSLQWTYVNYSLINTPALMIASDSSRCSIYSCCAMRTGSIRTYVGSSTRSKHTHVPVLGPPHRSLAAAGA